MSEQPTQPQPIQPQPTREEIDRYHERELLHLHGRLCSLEIDTQNLRQDLQQKELDDLKYMKDKTKFALEIKMLQRDLAEVSSDDESEEPPKKPVIVKVPAKKPAKKN